MNDFNQPPIPDPFQQQPVPQLASREWKNAPPIVKGWAYPLTWLAIIGLSIFLLITWIGGNETRSDPVGDGIVKIITSAIYVFFIVFNIWLNGALKKVTSAAWTLQIINSALGLCGFPIGTLIHAYVLSQWFKPEVKAWFGVN